MNGLRLGTFQSLVDAGFTQKEGGGVDWTKKIFAGALSGTLAGAMASPLYLVSDTGNETLSYQNQFVAVVDAYVENDLGN
jgi:hypothetical protein